MLMVFANSLDWMSGLTWSMLFDTDVIPWKDILRKKVMLKNICTQPKNHEKLPSMQRVQFPTTINVMLSVVLSIIKVWPVKTAISFEPRLEKICFTVCNQVRLTAVDRLSHVTDEMSRYPAKGTSRHVRPSKTQISLHISAVWSESSMNTLWVAKAPTFLQAEDSDHTVRMCTLSWFFAVCTYRLVPYAGYRLQCKFVIYWWG